ncbi:hypothetical protein SDC9_179761 [bioreactor metagenome]|uniref:Uncharacterized protein n=1 Tax=bioreactor metagenome TaxID=1076179 RepID=A0A645H926_9ZZZZ
MGDIDQGIPPSRFESMAPGSHTPHTSYLGNAPHFMVVYIYGVVRQRAGDVVAPILPTGAVVNISAAIDENILSSDHQLQMACVIM